VKKTLYIIVADRNRHVRDFLKRELEAESHAVQTACTLVDTITLILQDPHPDLLILDACLADPDTYLKFNRIINKFKFIPVILHTYDINSGIAKLRGCRVIPIEKKGNSIEKIKQVVRDIQVSLPASQNVEGNLHQDALSQSL